MLYPPTLRSPTPGDRCPTSSEVGEKMGTKASRFALLRAVPFFPTHFHFPEVRMICTPLNKSDTWLLTNGTISSSPPPLPTLLITAPPNLWEWEQCYRVTSPLRDPRNFLAPTAQALPPRPRGLSSSPSFLLPVGGNFSSIVDSIL